MTETINMVTPVSSRHYSSFLGSSSYRKQSKMLMTVVICEPLALGTTRLFPSCLSVSLRLRASRPLASGGWRDLFSLHRLPDARCTAAAILWAIHAVCPAYNGCQQLVATTFLTVPGSQWENKSQEGKGLNTQAASEEKQGKLATCVVWQEAGQGLMIVSRARAGSVGKVLTLQEWESLVSLFCIVFC